MMGVEVIGKFTKLNSDFRGAMRDAKGIMLGSVLQNFDSGGRPRKWVRLKESGQPSHLGGRSGKIAVNIKGRSDHNSATVYLNTPTWAGAHNFGATIKHPGSDKFQVFMFKGKKIFTHGTKPHNIRLPRRQFMLFQRQDIRDIKARVGEAVFETSQRR